MAKRFNLSVDRVAQWRPQARHRFFSTNQPTHIPVAIEMLTQLRTIKRTALLATMIRRRSTRCGHYTYASRAIRLLLSRARTRECYKISKRDLIPEEIRAVGVVRREAEGKDKYILYVWIYRSPKVIRRRHAYASRPKTNKGTRRSRNFVSVLFAKRKINAVDARKLVVFGW